MKIPVPRARVLIDGQEQEWRSRLLLRYQRRVPAVEAALLGAYFSGANGRRIKGALAPLSKSTLSRLV